MTQPLVKLGIAGFGYAFGEDQDVATVAGDLACHVQQDSVTSVRG